MTGPFLQVVSSAVIVAYFLLLQRRNKLGLPLCILANLIFLVGSLIQQQWALILLPIVLAGISVWNWIQWDKFPLHV